MAPKKKNLGAAASPDGQYFLPIKTRSTERQEDVAFAYNTSAQRMSIKHQLRLKASYPSTRLQTLSLNHEPPQPSPQKSSSPTPHRLTPLHHSCQDRPQHYLSVEEEGLMSRSLLTLTSHNQQSTVTSNKSRTASKKGASAPSAATTATLFPPTFQEVLEAERVRENNKKLKEMSVYLKPLQTKTVVTHSSGWDNTTTVEPVFKYDSVRDQFLGDYFTRSRHAQKCLVSHGIVTGRGKLVNMHHAGGKIWLAEKRHRNQEERKARDEDREEAERVVEEVRRKEMLKGVERAGRINKLRVAEHVAYLQKKTAREKEAARLKEFKQAQAAERRRQEEMEDMASYLLCKEQLEQRLTRQIGGPVSSSPGSSYNGRLSDLDGGARGEGDESVLAHFSAIQALIDEQEGECVNNPDDEDWVDPDEDGWGDGSYDEDGADSHQDHTSPNVTSIPRDTNATPTAIELRTSSGERVATPTDPRPTSSARRPSVSSNTSQQRRRSSLLANSLLNVQQQWPAAPWEHLSQMDPDLAEVVTV